MRTNVIGNLGHICIIKCSINLVKDEERRWLVAGGKKEIVSCRTKKCNYYSIG